MKMPSEVLREEILRDRAISFERFMEIALYCPETGYYETEKDIVGRGGDFITSVSVGSLFGELLAFQFAEWLAELKIQSEPLKIVEAGAHDGKLAGDILHWLQMHRPQLYSGIEYWILEPSLKRQSWQQETLRAFAPRFRWTAKVRSIVPARRQFGGIIFSNELLDAFPVRRFGWDAAGKNWFEWGVTLAGGTFDWVKISLLPPALPASLRHLPSPLLQVLPDGYTIEDSPGAAGWWHEAAGVLSHGKLLAIDYGFTAEEQLSPARTNGTLRAYHRHQVSADLLANPGAQDLTAHVNFTAIQNAGVAAGLTTEHFCTQPQFLTRILQKSVGQNSSASLNARQVRQFQTLTHPEHLGRAFRVLVQSRAGGE